ncbi:hypothetical protein KP509_19G054000 [Ceratopteris richardii]|uniref:Uncharacterized protein n=1 Tax=Ceratopteris richardii TaxID=49495 RepID=A0A8T2SP57_CERRI|nr:hypothetical protein KP509_19G054000 [Ceratopteris richardii]
MDIRRMERSCCYCSSWRERNVDKAADVVADILKKPPTLHSLEASLWNFPVEMQKNLGKCYKKILSQSQGTTRISDHYQESDDLMEPLSKSAKFNEALQRCKQNVTYRYEILQNNVGIIRPVEGILEH